MIEEEEALVESLDNPLGGCKALFLLACFAAVIVVGILLLILGGGI